MQGRPTIAVFFLQRAARLHQSLHPRAHIFTAAINRQKMQGCIAAPVGFGRVGPMRQQQFNTARLAKGCHPMQWGDTALATGHDLPARVFGRRQLRLNRRIIRLAPLRRPAPAIATNSQQIARIGASRHGQTLPKRQRDKQHECLAGHLSSSSLPFADSLA